MVSPLLVLPERILQSTLLQEVAEDHAVLVHLTFAAIDAHKDYERINGTYKTWADRVDWAAAGGEPEFVVSLNDHMLELGFSGVPRPSGAIQSLLEAYVQAGLPLQKAFVSVVELGEDGELSPHGKDESDLPEFSSLEDEDDLWKRSFDLSTVPPDSEDPDGMFAVATREDDSFISEFRPRTIYLPDVRIVYALGGVEDLDTDARCAHLLQRLREACRAYFAPVELEKLRFVNQEGQDNHSFDRIRKDGRVGYSFALRREDVMVSLGDHFRYMEYELMLAFRDLIRQERLQPTVHWDRGEVYIFNLWEKHA